MLKHAFMPEPRPDVAGTTVILVCGTPVRVPGKPTALNLTQAYVHTHRLALQAAEQMPKHLEDA
jgi:hypothetical protein